MADSLTRAERSERMSRVKSKHSQIEIRLRRLVFAMGYRYRLHGRNLPGTPDLVFASRQKAIFVNGCFWHQHGCGHYRQPKSRRSFWMEKLASNVKRDRRKRAALGRIGWKSMVVWECQIRKPEVLERRVRKFLDG